MISYLFITSFTLVYPMAITELVNRRTPHLPLSPPPKSLITLFNSKDFAIHSSIKQIICIGLN